MRLLATAHQATSAHLDVVAQDLAVALGAALAQALASLAAARHGCCLVLGAEEVAEAASVLRLQVLNLEQPVAFVAASAGPGPGNLRVVQVVRR